MVRTVFLILNYKTYQDTINLVNELISDDIGSRKVLVVDNLSPNESYSRLLKELSIYDNVEVISSGENGGYAKGNNFGLKYIEKYSPDYVCIINNDVHFSMSTITYLEEIYSQLEKPALISPIQMLPNGNKANFYELLVPDFKYDICLYSILLGNKQHKYISNTEKYNIQKVGMIPGAFIFTSYPVFKSIGFFNEKTFLFCEERFVAKEVELAGLNNYIVLDRTYLHEHSKTINSEASLRRQAKMMLEGRMLYAKTYYKYPYSSGLILRIAYYYWIVTRFIINKISW